MGVTEIQLADDYSWEDSTDEGFESEINGCNDSEDCFKVHVTARGTLPIAHVPFCQLPPIR